MKMEKDQSDLEKKQFYTEPTTSKEMERKPKFGPFMQDLSQPLPPGMFLSLPDFVPPRLHQHHKSTLNLTETIFDRSYGLKRSLGNFNSKKFKDLPVGSKRSKILRPVRNHKVGVFQKNVGETRLSQVAANSSLMNIRNLSAHCGCVNAVEFSPGEERLLASGGDDKRVLIWRTADFYSLQNVKPISQMRVAHDSNIFAIAFSHQSDRIFSSGNDHQIIMHNVETKDPVDLWTAGDAVYTINLHPTDDKCFITASEDGCVNIWDVRVSSREDPLVLAKRRAPFQAALFHPMEPQIVATANVKTGAQLWDFRYPDIPYMEFLNGKADTPHKSVMSVRWNYDGRRLLVLRRKLVPAVYEMSSPFPMATFDALGYHNSVTMKTCSFAGPTDSYVMSGSDDFNIYLWKVRKSLRPVKATMVLKGHKSIVNQVRYSAINQCIVSSGVEKVIKVWSPWSIRNRESKLLEDDIPARKMYTPEECTNIMIGNGGYIGRRMGIGEETLCQNTEEDPRMFAFFDSLVQREVENLDDTDGSCSCESSGEEDPSPWLTRPRPQTSSSTTNSTRQRAESNRYSHEVVESESSSSSAEGEGGNSDYIQSDSDILTSTNRILDFPNLSPWSMAYSRFLRRRGEEEQASATPEQRAELIRQGLNPDLGYLPNQPEAVRNATELVIRKRHLVEMEENRKARKRGRFPSEPGLSTSGGRGGEGLSMEETKKRLESVKKKCFLSVRQRRLRRLRKMVMNDLMSSSSSEDESGEAPGPSTSQPTPSDSNHSDKEEVNLVKLSNKEELNPNSAEGAVSSLPLTSVNSLDSRTDASVTVEQDQTENSERTKIRQEVREILFKKRKGSGKSLRRRDNSDSG